MKPCDEGAVPCLLGGGVCGAQPYWAGKSFGQKGRRPASELRECPFEERVREVLRERKEREES